MFINLLVRVIYLVIDNIKGIDLTPNKEVKKRWCDWLSLQDLNQRPTGYNPMHISYDRIIAITKNTRIRDQEERNKIFTIY